jgi:hypothetical protein
MFDLLLFFRFFELEITMQQVNVTSSSSPDDPAEIVFKPTITPTELRTDVAYNVYYVNLTRLLLTGALPIAMLGYLYCKVRPDTGLSVLEISLDFERRSISESHFDYGYLNSETFYEIKQ